MLYLGDLGSLAGGCGKRIAYNLDFRDIFGEVSNKFFVDTLLNKDTGCSAADLALVVEDTDVLCTLDCGGFHRDEEDTYGPFNGLVKLRIIKDQ